MGLFDIFKFIKNKHKRHYMNVDASILEKDQAEIRALKTFHKLQTETKVNCVKLELIDEKPDIFQSKVGGMGYIPHDGEFPTDSKGRQLRLLAQINCAEIKLNEYPKQGLLQFWILNDDISGMNFEDGTKQDTFRIIYHKDIDPSVTEDEIKSKFKENEFDKENMMPNNGEYKIKFNMDENSLSSFDGRFDTKFAEQYNQIYPDKTIASYSGIDMDIEEIDEDPSGFGHKIGGYPAFTQYDPRDENSPYNFLLLQLDSDFSGEDEKIMWGDAGIGNFFISSEKLKKLDFSDVIYNWDCC